MRNLKAPRSLAMKITAMKSTSMKMMNTPVQEVPTMGRNWIKAKRKARRGREGTSLTPR